MDPGKTRDELQWEISDLQDALISTVRDERLRDLLWSPCPLCGGGRESFGMDSPDVEGTFSVSEGLKRNLEGYGKMRQRLVLKAAIAAASRTCEE